MLNEHGRDKDDKPELLSLELLPPELSEPELLPVAEAALFGPLWFVPVAAGAPVEEKKSELMQADWHSP